MEEFGDPSVDATGISEAIEPHGEDGSSSNPISEPAIELKEISRSRERARAVDDPSGEAPGEPHHGKSLVRFLYILVMYLAHPPNIPCSGGAEGRGIGSRVIRITLQFGKNPCLPSRYFWHANDMTRLWKIRDMTSTRGKDR
jgi:hypothetical protein